MYRRIILRKGFGASYKFSPDLVGGLQFSLHHPEGKDWRCGERVADHVSLPEGVMVTCIMNAPV